MMRMRVKSVQCMNSALVIARGVWRRREEAAALLHGHRHPEQLDSVVEGGASNPFVGSGPGLQIGGHKPKIGKQFSEPLLVSSCPCRNSSALTGKCS